MIKKPLPTGEGKTVIWNLPYRLSKGYVLSEGSPVLLSAGNALSTYKVSAIVRQFGGFTDISDMVDMTSITDVMKMAYERLGAQAGETIERVIVNECFISHVTTTGGAPHHIVKGSASIRDVWGSVSGISTCANGITGGDEVSMYCSQNSVLSVSDVRAAIYKLKALNVPAYEGNDYVAIINTETAEDLVGDSTWINFHQYAAPGQANLYTGEIGKIYGCRFVETNLGPCARSVGDYASTASALVYGTVIMGKGYYGVTELDGGIKTYTSQGPQKSDILNQTTAIGWKANFIAKLLNTSAGVVLWAGSGETTVVGDESATGSSTRYKYPTSY